MLSDFRRLLVDKLSDYGSKTLHTSWFYERENVRNFFLDFYFIRIVGNRAGLFLEHWMACFVIYCLRSGYR